MRFLTTLILLTTATCALPSPIAPTPFATIGRRTQAPKIDGKLDDPCWQDNKSAVLTHFVRPDMSAFADADTTAHISYDNDMFFVGVRCQEPKMGQIKVHSKKRDTAVWRDDCIELFIDTNHDRKTYYHFIVNTGGTLYDKRQGADANWNADIVVETQKGKNYWAVEMAIPFDDIGGTPDTGKIWGFNLCRERKAGNGGLSAWSPTYAKFHEPQRFGEIRFADTPCAVGFELPDGPMFGRNEILITAPEAEPQLRLLRDWPDGVSREWATPPPHVEATDRADNWRAAYRVIDGSERAIVLTATANDTLLFRQSLPIDISPEPQTAALAEKVMALKTRIDGTGRFAEQMREVVQTARETLKQFVKDNLQRQSRMSSKQWRTHAGRHSALLERIGALTYLVWSKPVWKDLGRNEMPPELPQATAIIMKACCNETDCADIIVTNLAETAFAGRVEMSGLRLKSTETARAEDAANLLKNGDFSQDSNDDGIPDHWRPVQKDGVHALRQQADGDTAFVLSADDKKAVSTNFRQSISLKTGERYTLIAELSARGLPGRVGHVHVINNGWTWAKTASANHRTSRRMRYRRSFTAPESDRFQVVLRLASPSGGKIRFHNVKLIKGGAPDVAFSPRCMTLHRVEFQQLRGGKTVADPMPVMNEARILTVPAGESRQIWLNLDTSTLPPGQYQTTVSIKPFDRDLPPTSVPVDITVRPVHLPDKMPIAVYNWDYARNERYVRDLARHHNNTFLMNTHCRAKFDKDGNLREPIDWSGYDEMLQVKLRYARKCGGIVMFSYGIIRDFHRKYSKRHDWKFMSKPWKKAFKTWVLRFERHLREDIGIDYDEYAVQLWDEATRKHAEMTVEAGKFMRTFAPKIRTCMDGTQSVSEVKALDPVIDLWIPHQSALYSHREKKKLRALYGELMEKGEPVWTYTCSTRMKALDPLDYYRLKEWRVWQLGVQGSCFWAYNSWRGDPWNDFDGSMADCGTIYDGPGRPITSRRWEATRQGREDYRKLYMLQSAADNADGKQAKAIGKFISGAVERALSAPEDTENFENVSAELGEMISTHCGDNAPRLTRRPHFIVGDNAVTCSWRTDTPSAGTLYYRVPGNAEWNELRFPRRRRHVRAIADLPKLRNFEWYLIWWGDSGAAASTVAGLNEENWFRTTNDGTGG